MQRRRFLGIFLSVVLTVTLSLGFASAAGLFQAPPETDSVEPAQTVPTEVSVQSLVGSDVTVNAAQDGEGNRQAEDEGDDNRDDEQDDARDGTGRPAEKGLPPGQAKKVEAEGQALVEGGCVAHPTGVVAKDEAMSRFQVKHSGVHAIVLAADAKAACEAVDPSDILSAVTDLKANGDRDALRAAAGDFVASLEANSQIEHFNFYGPLAKLNQLRAPSLDEDDDRDDKSDDDRDDHRDAKDEAKKDKGAKASVIVEGEIKEIKGAKWQVGGTSVIVPPHLREKGKVGQEVKVTGVRAGNNVKATKIDTGKKD